MPDGGTAPREAPALARLSKRGGPTGSARHVMIACTLRSGSNLLCDMLRENGFGDPREYFQDQLQFGMGGHHVDADTRLLERQSQEFLDAHGASRWRGVKFDWQQFERLRRLAPGLPLTSQVFEAFERGRWILLRRRNLAAQAVSLYTAQMTGAWMGEDSADYARTAQDFDAIYERFAALAADAFAWDEYFRAVNLKPIMLYYEDIVRGDADSWCNLLRDLAPDFEAKTLSLNPLRNPPRRHPRIDGLKGWFEAELLAGRRPRSVLALLEEISRTVARVDRSPLAEGVLGTFAADHLARSEGFRLRKLDLGRDVWREGQATMVQQQHFLDGVALRLDPEASCGFEIGARRLMLQFYTHAWSGIAEIRIGDTLAEIDLFSERADTRHFIRDLPADFLGPVIVRSTGGKNLLSKGAEIWLQRGFVLEDGSG
jgi:LPS sulfotransferase NodH